MYRVMQQQDFPLFLWSACFDFLHKGTLSQQPTFHFLVPPYIHTHTHTHPSSLFILAELKVMMIHIAQGVSKIIPFFLVSLPPLWEGCRDCSLHTHRMR